MSLVSRSDHAARITSAYAIAAIVDVGKALLEAKVALPYGEFTAMVERDLPFGERLAQQFMRVARRSNPQNSADLPAALSTLDALAGLALLFIRTSWRGSAIH